LLKLAPAAVGITDVSGVVVGVVVGVDVEIFLAAHRNSGKLDRKGQPPETGPVIEEIVPLEEKTGHKLKLT
jgi:hypothetical protein